MKSPTSWLLGALAALIFLAGPQPAAAQMERILDFRSEIVVHGDSSMTVTEIIRVVSTGSRIKRGIYRAFPTTYKDRFGNTVRVGFEVVKILRDGRPEPYRVREFANGKRIYIGDKNTFLQTGEYTYTIIYITDRQLGFFDEFDELYWNVTGNGWAFTIGHASAVVKLPPGAQVLHKTAYTGRQGAKGGDFTTGLDASGNITFATTRPLNPREGLTIAVSWPKDIVEAPSFTDKIGYLLLDNTALLASLGGVLALFAYFLVVWSKVGKDPAKGTIIPLYAPPKGFTPAAMRFVMRMGYSDKVFAAAVVSMAVKRYLTIEESAGGDFTLIRTQAGDSVLSPGEKQIAQQLFPSSGEERIELARENHTEIRAAIDALKASLKKDFGKIHFRRNVGYLAPGVLLIVFNFVAATLFESLYMVGAMLAIVPMNFAFYYLLKAPTLTGRRVMDQIEGFKLYLSVAAVERNSILHPPGATAELSEKYLPFALALDVEHEWSEQFAEVLAVTGKAGEQGYSPNWYSGRSWNSLGKRGGLASSLGGSLSGAISSSSTPPGSSSGGGGGFSGGGGGGGGGGGW